jgi:Protein of unknown function (DUF3106)
MTRTMPVLPRLSAVFLLCYWSAGSLDIGNAAPIEPSALPHTHLPGPDSSNTNAVQRPVPAPPGSKTSAEYFRELLEMGPRERAQALADRPESQRKLLEGRLREYEALPKAQREARLQQFELDCHLDGLMKLASTNRALIPTRLALVPAYLRPIVDERLRQWDGLSPKVQQEVLEYETTANYFLRVRPTAPPIPGATSTLATPPVPGAEEKPGKLAEHLNQFLELSSREQQKTLETLPVQEREAMEQTLRAFANLTVEQRKICISSFEKFSRMDKDQRDQFLKNAARWKAMSPRERETWRTLMQIVPSGPIAPTSPAPALPGADLNAGPATASNSPVVPVSGK